jgi:LacI family transcriptional regulator
MTTMSSTITSTITPIFIIILANQLNRTLICRKITYSEEAHPRKVNGSVHATLRDVAELAGVSTKTVSRVVNNQGEIAEATRERVQAAIKQLGYRPNILARSLIHQRTNTLAVVAWGIDYFGPSRTLVGIEQQAHELGYSLFLNLVSQPDNGDHERVLDELITHRVEGIIWAVPEVGNNRAWLKSVHLEQLPPMIFLSMHSQPGTAVVAVDNRDGARQATQHLIDQGRRKIGIITGPLSWWEARERLQGWRDALTQSGHSPHSMRIVEANWSAASGEQSMYTLLTQEPDLDAVFASSDQIALGALGTAYRLGRRVPGDLAIVGFDNIPDSAYFLPPLSTIYQQLIEVGRISVQTLHKIIQARQQGQEYIDDPVTILKPELIIRASSLPV